MTDAQNPAAVAYATMRLKSLASQGITAAQYGLQGLDPTAQWRALSTIVGAQQAVSSGHASEYHTAPGTPDSVAQYVQSLLSASQTPDTAPPGDDVVRPGQPQGRPYSASGPVRPQAQSAPLNHPAPSPLPPPSRAIPGQLAQAVQRLGPMQAAIHTAAGVRFLRSMAGRD